MIIIKATEDPSREFPSGLDASDGCLSPDTIEASSSAVNEPVPPPYSFDSLPLDASALFALPLKKSVCLIPSSRDRRGFGEPIEEEGGEVTAEDLPSFPSDLDLLISPPHPPPVMDGDTDSQSTQFCTFGVDFAPFGLFGDPPPPSNDLGCLDDFDRGFDGDATDFGMSGLIWNEPISGADLCNRQTLSKTTGLTKFVTNKKYL